MTRGQLRGNEYASDGILPYNELEELANILAGELTQEWEVDVFDFSIEEIRHRVGLKLEQDGMTISQQDQFNLVDMVYKLIQEGRRELLQEEPNGSMFVTIIIVLFIVGSIGFFLVRNGVIRF
jgi:hypothetical protein